MGKDKLQSIISEEKMFITGSKVKLNYSFVPAIANRLFKDYMQRCIAYAPEVFKLNEKLEDEEYKELMVSDKETLDDFNKNNEALKEEGEEINALGLRIILMILERNEQPIEVTEDSVLTEMDINDMNRFLRDTCSVSGSQKKNK